MLFPKGKTKFIRPDGSIGRAPGHGIVLLGMGKIANAALHRSGLGFCIDTELSGLCRDGLKAAAVMAAPEEWARALQSQTAMDRNAEAKVRQLPEGRFLIAPPFATASPAERKELEAKQADRCVGAMTRSR